MGVKIADGDSIAYWQTTDRDSFDGGPFIIRNHAPAPKPEIITLALPAAEPTAPKPVDAS